MPPDVPPPETLPDFTQRLAPHRELIGDWYDQPRPIDLRYVPPDPLIEPDVKRTVSAGVDARRRRAARRPGAARLHRHLRSAT